MYNQIVMNTPIKKQRVGSRPVDQIGKEGTTLVEVLASVLIIGTMAAAIYVAGVSVLRHAQAVTITTAAHLYAEEGLEEAIAAGYDLLSGGEPVEQEIMVNPNTHKVNLVRTENIIWHAPDGSVSSNALAEGYAEVVVRVAWQVPRTSITATTAMSTLVF